jgi:hypothetical protein
MPGKAAKLTITEAQQDMLQASYRSTMAPSRPRHRASIISMAFDDLFNEAIAHEAGLVHRWRWAIARGPLIDLECSEFGAASWRQSRRRESNTTLAILRSSPT